jgi:hypothetical protein
MPDALTTRRRLRSLVHQHGGDMRAAAERLAETEGCDVADALDRIESALWLD